MEELARLSVIIWIFNHSELKRDIENKLEECLEGYKSLEAILNRRKKKYKKEEMEGKTVLLDKIKDNFDVLKGLFLD